MKRLIRKLAIAFATGGTLYGVAAYFLAPPLLHKSLTNYAEETYALELQISTVKINPFTLAVELQDVHLAHHEQASLFHSPSVYANINLTDLLRRPLAINELNISRPQITLNYSGQDHPGAVRALVGIINTDMDAAPLQIDTINLREGTMQISLVSAANPIVTFNQINFQARHLASDQGDTEYSLTFTESSGGSFRLKGSVNLHELSGSGEFMADDLTPLTLSSWVDTLAELDQVTGQIRVMGEYTFSSGDEGSRLALTDSRLNVSAFGLHTDGQPTLAIREAAIGFDASLSINNDPVDVAINNLSARFDEITFSDADAIDTVSSIQIDGGFINPANRSVDIAEIRVSGSRLAIRGDRESRLVQPGPIASVLHAVTRNPRDWTDWQFTLNEFTTEDLELSLIDITDDAPRVHHFSEITLLVRNFSSTLDQRVDFEADMVSNPSGSFTANGWLDLHARSLQAAITIDELDLVSFTPYLQHISPLTLASALGSADVRLSYEEEAASIDGQFEIDAIRLAHDDGGPALTLSKLAASGLTLTTSPLHAAVKNLQLDDLHIDVEQSSEGMLNVSEWINPGNGRTSGEARPLSAAQGFPLAIEQVQVTGASVNFTDRRLIPALTLQANAVSGDISSLRLSTGTSPFVPRMSPYQPVEFEFTGQLNDSGRITLSGQAWQTPTGLTRQVSLELNDMNATLLSPYAGRHLSREIDSGQFDLDLDYRVDANLIKGRHHVHFDRLQLGQETSTSRDTLPSLELALALLQDEHDQINLTSPISANIEQTGLAIHAIAARAFTDKLAAILDNPFETLGEITAVTDNPLNMIPFEAGSAGVNPDAAQRLHGLSEALRQRPGLALRIAGGYDPGIDRNALARQQIRLHVSLAAAGDRPPGGTVTTLDMSDPRIQEVLDEFIEERLGRDKLPELDPSATGTPRFYQAVFDALVDEEEIAASALESLAKYRLQSIRAELVKSGVREDRLIITSPLSTEISDDGIVLIKLDVTTL